MIQDQVLLNFSPGVLNQPLKCPGHTTQSSHLGQTLLPDHSCQKSSVHYSPSQHLRHQCPVTACTKAARNAANWQRSSPLLTQKHRVCAMRERAKEQSILLILTQGLHFKMLGSITPEEPSFSKLLTVTFYAGSGQGRVNLLFKNKN